MRESTSKTFVCVSLFVASFALSSCKPAFSQESKPDSNTTRKEKVERATGIDFCLISEKYVKGLTHPNGVRLTDAAALDDLKYPLLKPVFTLTAKHVKSCELKASINPFNKKHLQYDVCVELNDLGKAEMFAAFKGVNDAYTRNVGLKGSGKPLKGAYYLWVVNGKPFSVDRYFRPEWTTPKAIGEYGRPNGKLSISAFSERDRAFGQSFVDALKPNEDQKVKNATTNDKQRLKSDQDQAVAWFKKEWMARVKYSEGRVIGLVFPGFSNVTDEVLDVVATFPDLESLAVVGAQVTDSGWKSLAKLQNLRKLAIISTRTFTDEEMKYLAGLRKLEVLDLSSTKKVTDAGIESIKGLTNLRDVDLDFTKVTDRSLELLGGNEGLEKLWLTATPISDEGMKSLAKFQRLRHVDLQSTNVTDEGLQVLRACKELKQLSVNSTKITKEGAKRFNQTLPKCQVVFAPTDIGG